MAKLILHLLAAGAAVLISSAPASAEPKQVKGIIVTNQNGQLTLTTEYGNQTINVAADAKIESVSGPFGGQRDTVPVTALIAGLPISVDADDATGQLVGSKIEYKASDYKTAAQIQAGVEATAVKQAELTKAYSQMGEWDVQKEATVYFKSGSAVVSSAGKTDLATLAAQAKDVQGYMISVLGFADPTGNAAANQRLSDVRAQNVINLLKQNPEIQPGRVLAASAMGEVKINGAADPSSYSSARRVTVRLLKSKALLPPSQ